MAGVVRAKSVLAKLGWATSPWQQDPQVDLCDILVGLQLLATDDDRDAAAAAGWLAGTPPSMQVMKSGSLRITKAWTAVGGLTGVGAAGAGVVSAFSDWGLTQVERSVLIGGCALVVASVAFAVALLIQADLQARGRATAARHAGRAEVAAAFLQATGQLPAGKPAAAAAPVPAGGNMAATGEHATEQFPRQLLLALAAFPKNVRVRVRSTGSWGPVTGIRTDQEEGLQVCVAGNDWRPVAALDLFTTDPG